MTKTALITGATDGIGRETARQLVDSGLRVLVHGRSEAKAARQAAGFARTGTGQAVPVWGDLSKMAEVALLADQVRRLAPKLDVLVNNAGVFEKRRVITADGFELTMAVNHFAVYLLTRRLVDCLTAAAQGRVVIVSSMVHQGAALDLDDLGFERGWEGYQAYAASKLANVLFTRALARRLAGSRVTANVLHPGVIGTKLLRAAFSMQGASVEQGARTSVFLATADAAAAANGKYFVDCRETAPSRTARDETLAEALWERSEQLLAAFL
jgi:NAD(P)-dependent dehydrogenase (short-subunit alcohol dehydrogenase family)